MKGSREALLLVAHFGHVILEFVDGVRHFNYKLLPEKLIVA
jgi:hypothetical protein